MGRQGQETKCRICGMCPTRCAVSHLCVTPLSLVYNMCPLQGVTPLVSPLHDILRVASTTCLVSQLRSLISLPQVTREEEERGGGQEGEPGGAESIDFVNKDRGGSMMSCHIKQDSHKLFRLAPVF